MEEKSKLDHVNDSLMSNPDVVVVASLVKTSSSFPESGQGWAQLVDYRVAPRVGLYNIEDLQEFMMGLIPDLQYTQKDDFRVGLGKLEFGLLYFDEIFARTIVSPPVVEFAGRRIPDEDRFREIAAKKYSSHPEQVIVREYDRRIWVKPFPNILVASHSLVEDGPARSMPLDDIAKYRLPVETRIHV